MTDRIAIRGMRVFGRHGANAGEQNIPQLFEVDVELEVDLERATHTDALGDTIDYAQIYKTVEEVVRHDSFSLLERLAQEIVRRVLQGEHVNAVTVTVAKPALLMGATPSITLRRTR